MVAEPSSIYFLAIVNFLILFTKLIANVSIVINMHYFAQSYFLIPILLSRITLGSTKVRINTALNKVRLEFI